LTVYIIVCLQEFYLGSRTIQPKTGHIMAGLSIYKLTYYGDVARLSTNLDFEGSKYTVILSTIYLLVYYPLTNEVAKGYSNTTVRPSFRSILVNTLESTSFNGF
jgi:hypothetical protein